MYSSEYSNRQVLHSVSGIQDNHMVFFPRKVCVQFIFLYTGYCFPNSIRLLGATLILIPAEKIPDIQTPTDHQQNHNCQDSHHDSPDNIGYDPTSLFGNLLASFSLILCLPGWLSSLLHYTYFCILFLWGINNIQTTKNCQPSMPRTTAYWFLTCLPDILRIY